MSRRRFPRWLAVAVSATLAAGCGATLEDHPRPIDRDDVPFGLLDEPTGEDPSAAPSSTTTTTTGPPRP